MATRLFDAAELPKFLQWGACWIQKVRETERLSGRGLGGGPASLGHTYA